MPLEYSPDARQDSTRWVAADDYVIATVLCGGRLLVHRLGGRLLVRVVRERKLLPPLLRALLRDTAADFARPPPV